jgi:hypothetical protein
MGRMRSEGVLGGLGEMVLPDRLWKKQLPLAIDRTDSIGRFDCP